MRAHLLVGLASLAALGGCGLESLFGSAIHKAYERPASTIRGTVPGDVTAVTQLYVTDADGNAVAPFQKSLEAGQFELRLPSSKYTMLVVHARAGFMELRALVPFVGEESSVSGVDLGAVNMTEMLVTEARLSHDGARLRQLTPSTYLATRALIRAAMVQAGPTQDLLQMVERVMAKNDPSVSQIDPSFFRVPALVLNDPGYALATGSACGLAFGVTCSPLDASWLARSVFDYTGDGVPDRDSVPFDGKLSEVAQLYRPAGCPDPDHVRLMFTVDFNQGAVDGTCSAVNRFKWATDKPGKSMFFVGWIYTTSACGIPPSDYYDTDVANRIGNSTPNVIPMYDDGTNGDEVAGDNVWTVYFDVPKSTPGHVLRLGYKYTWGTFGAPWTGSEEWPGNGRLLEVVDQNGDGFIYRRDVFGDESTNKDCANLAAGSITWTTDLRGCGYPESHENEFVLHSACACGTEWHTPTSVGPITIPCGP